MREKVTGAERPDSNCHADSAQSEKPGGAFRRSRVKPEPDGGVFGFHLQTVRTSVPQSIFGPSSGPKTNRTHQTRVTSSRPSGSNGRRDVNAAESSLVPHLPGPEGLLDQSETKQTRMFFTFKCGRRFLSLCR